MKLLNKEKKDKFVFELLDTLRWVIICFVIVFLCTRFVFKPVRVDGESMYPTLENEEYGVSNVFSALLSDFERFDVVVVNYEETDSQWVKRIIGLPNETIEYRDDKLYIDGKYVKEPFFDEDYRSSQTMTGISFTENFGPITLQDDEYFLMGDNRPVSYDSRRVGPFKESTIVSKSVIIVYPFDKVGIVNDGTK